MTLSFSYVMFYIKTLCDFCMMNFIGVTAQIFQIQKYNNMTFLNIK